jgi:hypothetical protein
MQAPFQLTKSRKLYNDSMWKQRRSGSNTPYKIVVVRTCILKFLHSDPPVSAPAEGKLVFALAL